MKLPNITADFRAALPFPHTVLDDLFDRDLVAAAAREVPVSADDRWSRHSNKLNQKLPKKLGITDLRPFPSLHRLCEQMQSREFVRWLSETSGIELIADGTLSGAGLHGIQPGGLLGMHVDFDRLGPLYRRLNAFVYLNPDWQPAWGGSLELHSNDGECVTSTMPTLGRFVAFQTSDQSWHGHPRPLTCPDSRIRASLAVYYYSTSRPDWYSEDHSTIYRDLR